MWVTVEAKDWSWHLNKSVKWQELAPNYTPWVACCNPWVCLVRGCPSLNVTEKCHRGCNCYKKYSCSYIILAQSCSCNFSQ